MYEEASGYGLRSGVTLPMHGPKGELGILCFVNDAKPSKQFERDAGHVLPELSLLRDVAFQSGADFALMGLGSDGVDAPAEMQALTVRELECLKWAMAGKTSWETGRILGVSESTVNFHVSNINRKLGVHHRNQAVIKAIRLGIL
jgi:LuxR family quorum-sensing transcriptional regulator LasR